MGGQVVPLRDFAHFRFEQLAQRNIALDNCA